MLVHLYDTVGGRIHRSSHVMLVDLMSPVQRSTSSRWLGLLRWYAASVYLSLDLGPLGGAHRGNYTSIFETEYSNREKKNRMPRSQAV